MSSSSSIAQDSDRQYHMKLLHTSAEEEILQSAMVSPIVTRATMQRFAQIEAHDSSYPTQMGLLAGRIDRLTLTTRQMEKEGDTLHEDSDPRIFFNISVPSSMFICGSQGSGKSHTLSCVLENCLMLSSASYSASPLAGLLFHYDSFISDDGGSPCEAAFLASSKKIEVRVLCAPTNLLSIRQTYRSLPVTVEALQIRETDLNSHRMLELMAARQTDGQPPLYVHVVRRILRELRMEQQQHGEPFSYWAFKNRLLESDLTAMQLGPLMQRLDTLESFMAIASNISRGKQQKQSSKNKGPKQHAGTSWQQKPGTLTIVDLSCPFVNPETACQLFNICLGLFLEQAPLVGRVIALDEAHKYMTSSTEAMSLTEALLSTVRLQRHLGVRVIISTQEPTISPKLLDLCSVTIVHRFTSPDWLRSLQRHLAASRVYNEALHSTKHDLTTDEPWLPDIMDVVLGLKVGEALLFSPNSVLESQDISDSDFTAATLGRRYLHVRIRDRLTADGGKSLLN